MCWNMILDALRFWLSMSVARQGDLFHYTSRVLLKKLGSGSLGDIIGCQRHIGMLTILN